MSYGVLQIVELIKFGSQVIRIKDIKIDLSNPQQATSPLTYIISTRIHEKKKMLSSLYIIIKNPRQSWRFRRGSVLCLVDIKEGVACPLSHSGIIRDIASLANDHRLLSTNPPHESLPPHCSCIRA